MSFEITQLTCSDTTTTTITGNPRRYTHQRHLVSRLTETDIFVEKANDSRACWTKPFELHNFIFEIADEDGKQRGSVESPGCILELVRGIRDGGDQDQCCGSNDDSSFL